MKNSTKDYVKVSKVSERITGEPLKIRNTTPKFKQLIAECNETVEQILTKSELNKLQKRQEKRMHIKK
jgi:hypothetical protein